jgi:hypothetical protein
MKKKSLNNLKLNKKSISSLNVTNINGGAIDISKLIGCVTGSCPNERTISCESWGSLQVCECTL